MARGFAVGLLDSLIATVFGGLPGQSHYRRERSHPPCINNRSIIEHWTHKNLKESRNCLVQDNVLAATNVCFPLLECLSRD
ncbi:hypothetical protein C8R43DRAFT_1007527 [Mycena crocata]|nr:hypothetical protein C8R43DRAFT_1007527 [Mycena crocata]